MQTPCVLISGVNGFIGSHLAKKLNQDGWRVIGICRQTSNLWRFSMIPECMEIIRGDLGSLYVDELSLPGEIDFFFHVAAAGVNPSEEDHEYIIKENIIGTLHALQLAQRFKVKRFIYVGSCFEYGGGSLLSEDMVPSPLSEYGVSKASAWLLTQMFSRRYGLPIICVRPFTVYGPYENGYRLIPYLIMRMQKNIDVELTGGEQSRDFIYIEDVVNGLCSAAESEMALGGTFNLCTGIETSVKNTALMIKSLLKSESKILLGQKPYRGGEMFSLSGDIKHAKDMLQWSAKVSFSKGLEETIHWFSINTDLYNEK